MPYPQNLVLSEDSGVVGPNASRQGPNQADAAFLDANGNFTISAAGHLLATGGAPPTAAAGANAGGTPPAPLETAGSTDIHGQITFGTGTVPAAGNEVVVTFATPFGAAPLSIMIEPANGPTAALQPYVTAITTTGFTVGAQVAPAASQANTVYAVQYLVVGQS